MLNFEHKEAESLKIVNETMEKTLAILKPSAIARGITGKVIDRISNKGLQIIGMKMMQLDEALLREHYAHLVEKPFFPHIVESMTATPVVVMCLKGVEAVSTFRALCGVTNGRKAAPGTIRGDFSMSNQENIVHASDSVENAEIEIRRFFKPEEICDYTASNIRSLYAADEII